MNLSHVVVMEGHSCSERRDQNVMGEVRQAKGSQRKPGQKAGRLLSSPAIRWAATGEQKVLERKETAMLFSFSHLKPPALHAQGKHEARNM